MNSKIVIRAAIYGALAFIVFSQDALRDMPEFKDVTMKAWIEFVLGATASVLVPIRAFIDQTVARDNGNGKPPEVK